MNFNTLIFEAAGQHIGEAEWPGAKHNPVIAGFFEASGNPQVKADEVPWCAAFVGAVLAQVGLTGTGKLNARSYMEWGVKVSLRDAKPGDVVILWRESPQSWKGHVAFFVRWDGTDRVILRGGNQRNRVSDDSYPISQILGVRRAVKQDSNGRATVRYGSTGAFVYDLQDNLIRHGFYVGKRDGIFGDETRNGLLAFQAKQDPPIEVDGIAGAETWAALDKPVARDMRDVDAKELRKRGSTTIKNADTIDVLAGASALGTTATAVSQAASDAEGALAVTTRLITDHWPTLLVVAALVGVVLLSNRIRASRVKDAQTGAHMGR